MDERLVALAIPVFLLAMVVEWLVNRAWLQRKGRQSPTGGIGGYRLADTLTDLGAGIGQQALDPLLRIIGVGAFVAVQSHLALLQWDLKSLAQWLAAVVLVDLCFYWFHRASHRVNLLWAVHHVHHSSDEYNLAVALRQPWLEKLVDIPFYLPLALLGMPVEMYLGAFTIDLLYQFFIHTRWVPKLGPLEWVLNTPSHHRVHHGVNPQYIDTNYGGVLIVFDRLFGTFVAESVEPTFGTVKPLRSWSAPWANVVVWADLWQASRTTRNIWDKLRIWWAPPEWRPHDLGGKVTIAEPVASERGWQGAQSPQARRFAIAALLAVVALMLPFLWTQATLRVPDLCLFAAGAIALMAAWGAALEGRPFAKPLALVSVLGLGLGWPLWAGWSVAAVAVCAVGTAGLVVLAVQLRPVGPQAAGC